MKIHAIDYGSAPGFRNYDTDHKGRDDSKKGAD
jgi:hypothetical protein